MKFFCECSFPSSHRFIQCFFYVGHRRKWASLYKVGALNGKISELVNCFDFVELPNFRFLRPFKPDLL